MSDYNVIDKEELAKLSRESWSYPLGGGGGGNVLEATLVTGETTVTITDDSIKDDSMIDVYTDVHGVNPSDISVASGTITLTFDAQEADVIVKVRVS